MLSLSMKITFIYFASLFHTILSADVSVNSSVRDVQKSIKLPPCASCRVLSESFKKGMEKTSRGKFDGGDAAWEESKMGSYKKSEVRLVEIQEKLCHEVERGQNQCLTAAEDNESLLEEWWFNVQDVQPDLHVWLCIENLKDCCPLNHFGPNCLPCRGGIESPCGEYGKCKGSGTRKGNGQCDCNKGYEGEKCDKCSTGYYEAYKDDNKFLCDSCHVACQGHCNGAGPKSCVACQPGWIMDTEKGCLDIDECSREESACKKNEYCINRDGSHVCQKCHVACNGCNGDGADMCRQCADGFMQDGEFCIDMAPIKREESMTFSRYVVYVGLTVATCIILQRHTTLAAIVGLIVAIYISFTEYYVTYIDSESKHVKSQNNENNRLPFDFE